MPIPMPSLSVGLKVSAEQFGPRDLVDYTVLADDIGLDSVWISDHFLPWRDNGGHAPFSLAWMAAAGERTRRVALGTSVLTPTFRYNPAVLAQAFATMGLLFPGRVILGVGTGEALNEKAVSGRDWPEFKERFARLREAVAMMRALWTEDEVTRKGDFYDLSAPRFTTGRRSGAGVHRRWRPGRVQVRRPGRGRLHLHLRQGHVDSTPTILFPAVTAGAEAAGRDVNAIDRMIEIKMSYDRDPDVALENCRFWAPLSLTAEQKHSVSSATEMERLADELPIEQVAKRWIVASTTEQAIAQIEPYVRAGFTHLVFHGPGADQRRFLDQFSQDVLPALRALPAGGEVTSSALR